MVLVAPTPDPFQRKGRKRARMIVVANCGTVLNGVTVALNVANFDKVLNFVKVAPNVAKDSKDLTTFEKLSNLLAPNIA
ncbi:MAG: hypothetical protein A2046_01150 [Bacteroidetes bacterium GWA2_30_7]|nr:MAG: hypothetical protein A2046_01150 [Bacteroidetes bacterium GWA2_30_7]